MGIYGQNPIRFLQKGESVMKRFGLILVKASVSVLAGIAMILIAIIVTVIGIPVIVLDMIRGYSFLDELSAFARVLKEIVLEDMIAGLMVIFDEIDEEGR